MEQKKYRTLLPAEPGASAQPSAPYKIPARKRGALTTAACEGCRKRKIKCTGERPRCTPCLRRGQDCHYDTELAETHSHARRRRLEQLQAEKEDFEQLIDFMRTRTEEEAHAILLQLRAGVDVSAIVRQVRDGDLLLQLSLVPETKYRYEFPMIKEMPPYLLRPNNEYLESSVYQWTARNIVNNPVDTVMSSSTSTSVEPQACYLHPFHIARIEDSLLDSVLPSRWTVVMSNDEFMRELLHQYFLEEHAWWSFFPGDLFLRDMAAGRDRFCSSLLVNAVLALGCLTHRGLKNRAEFWNPQNLTYQFLSEARMLWDMDQDEGKLTTVHAALVMNQIHNVNGFDKIGWTYTVRAAKLLQDPDFIKHVQSPERSQSLDGVSSPQPRNWSESETNTERQDLSRAHLYTQWSLFSYQSHQCYHFFRAPLLDCPPDEPLPDPNVMPEWYGDFQFRYHSNEVSYPVRHAQLFKAKAELRIIMNDIGCYYFRRDGVTRRGTRENVDMFHSRLSTWFKNLPDVLSPKSIVWPAHFLLHLQYHNLIMNLFEPLIVRKHTPLRIASIIWEDGPDENIPENIQQEATSSFETLIRIYYLRHGFDFLDTSLLHSLMVLSFMSLRRLAAQSSVPLSEAEFVQSTFLLAAIGLCRQGQNIFFPRTLLRLLRDTVGIDEVRLMERFLRPDSVDGTNAARLSRLQSAYPLNIIDISEDPSESRFFELVKRYEDLSVTPASEIEASLSASPEYDRSLASGEGD